jgi:hypothetical protein
MNTTDWIGFIGVTILLIAYLLNLGKIIKQDSAIYLFLNILGAGIACFASILLDYLPFIILEACWTVVSAFGLVSFWMKKK